MVELQQDGVANIATSITFIIMDSLAVILRIISKGKTKHRFSSDDLWILLALLFFYVWGGLILYSVAGITGTLNMPSLTDPLKLQNVLKILWIAQMFFPLTITFIKISILCFYRTIFVTKGFRIATTIIMIFCFLWLISGFFVVFFQCQPFRAVYDVKLAAKARCIPFAAVIFAAEFVNASLDVAILALPIFAIRKLQMQTWRKWQVRSMFLLGGFVVITCVLRMVYTFDPKDVQNVPSHSRAVLWSTIELGVALICACLPTYGPLLPKSFGLSATVRSWYSSIQSAMRSRPRFRFNGASKNTSSEYTRYADHGDDSIDMVNLTEALGGRSTDSRSNTDSAYPLHNISVESRVEIFR